MFLLIGQLLVIDGGLHVEAVGLRTGLRGDNLLLLVVVIPELLGVIDYPLDLDLLLGQTALQETMN